MNKLLSIIIPSCNMEKYLAQCLESLIIPSIDDVEILVINDGSKDRTSEIGHEYEAKYPVSIRVIDKPNGHYGSCINRGLAEATGKYIRVLDADDSFETPNFEKFISWLKNQDADLLISDYCLVDDTGSFIETRKMLPAKFDFLKNINVADVIYSPKRKFFAMHGLTYKLSILRALKYSQTEGVAYTDQEWNFIPMTGVYTVGYYAAIVYKYLVGRQGQSISHNVMMKSMPTQLMLIDKRIDAYADCKDKISDAHSYYLTSQLYQPLVNTYSTILTNESLNSLLPTLRDIDAKIKTIDVCLYNRMDNYIFSRSKLKIIKSWRRNNYKLSKSLRLLRVLKKMRIL